MSRNRGLRGPVCPVPGWQLARGAPWLGPTWLGPERQAEAGNRGRAALEGRRNFDELNCPTAASDMPEKEKISHEALLHPERES